jgi:hypothetical protein
MAFAAGIVVAIVTGMIGRLAGFDRDRAFYPTVVIVTASYYVLFAAMAGSTSTIIVELIAVIGFASAAIVGFRSSLWLVAAALAGHGAFDLVHDRFVSNPGVPEWWPAFCLTFDVLLAGFLAWILHSRRLPAREAEPGPRVG